MSDDHDPPGAVAPGRDNPALQPPPCEPPSGLGPQRACHPDLSGSVEAADGAVLPVLVGQAAAALGYRRSLFRR